VNPHCAAELGFSFSGLSHVQQYLAQIVVSVNAIRIEFQRAAEDALGLGGFVPLPRVNPAISLPG